MTRRLSLTGLLLIVCFSAALAQMEIPKEYKSVCNEGFSNDKALRGFEFSDNSQWLISKVGKPGKSMKCTGAGNFENSLGGPSILAVLKGYEFDDFVMELDVVQNGKDFNLLDFCIFFGIQDKNNFSYAQLASHADRKAHNIFVQKGETPVRLGEPKTEGVIFGHKQWNSVRVERMVSAKTLKVYFNNELVLESTEEPFMTGHIGFGSTKSAIKVDNLRIWAPSVTETKENIF